MPFDPVKTRLERVLAQRDAEQNPPALDPPFPYAFIPFDPFFFGLQEDAPEPEGP